MTERDRSGSRRARALLLVLTLSLGAAGSASNSAPTTLLPTIVTPDGKTPLASVRGKTVIINFWASWCVPCRAELLSLERLAASHPGDLTVVAASVDTDRNAALAAFGNRYPHLRLGFSSLAAVEHFGALGMPYSAVLDAKGRDRKRVTHSLDWSGAEGKATLKAAGFSS